MDTLTWLWRMTFVEIGVIPYLFLAMPLVAAVVKRQAMPSAVGLTILTFATPTPTLMLVWAVFAFGQAGTSGGSKSYHSYSRWPAFSASRFGSVGPHPDPQHGLLSASPSAHSFYGVVRSS